MTSFLVWANVVTLGVLIAVVYYACQPFDESYGEHYVP